jgi:hypothetical protein
MDEYLNIIDQVDKTKDETEFMLTGFFEEFFFIAGKN